VDPIEAPSRTSPGKSLAIPVGSGETLPELPPEGIELANTSIGNGEPSRWRVVNSFPARTPGTSHT